MKQSTFSVASLIVIAGLTCSCNRNTRLANAITGAWRGVPEQLFDVSTSSATIIETYSFSLSDSSSTGGPAIVTSLISVTGVVDGTEGISRPVSVTASGYTTIQGVWTATSGDEIELHLDRPTLSVNIDPDAVIVTGNTINNSNRASTAVMRPQLASSISEQLHAAMLSRYSPVQKLKNVSITDGKTLKFKIGKSSFTLTRQPD